MLDFKIRLWKLLLSVIMTEMVIFIYLLIIFVPDAIITTDNVKLLMVHDFKHEVHIADETL